MESIFGLVEWATTHSSLIAILAVVSILTSVIYAIGVVVAVIRMSPDYFFQKRTLDNISWQNHHPFLYIFPKILRNLGGIGLIILGLAMLILPGQGILTLVIGLSLLDFPGKRRLELWFVRRSRILKVINKIRKKARRDPLIVPEI
tara:strand:- start:3900 stop:4337 length:438 start_codon:yes stop_codon:yes gene_type:complete